MLMLEFWNNQSEESIRRMPADFVRKRYDQLKEMKKNHPEYFVASSCGLLRKKKK